MSEQPIAKAKTSNAKPVLISLAVLSLFVVAVIVVKNAFSPAATPTEQVSAARMLISAEVNAQQQQAVTTYKWVQPGSSCQVPPAEVFGLLSKSMPAAKPVALQTENNKVQPTK